MNRATNFFVQTIFWTALVLSALVVTFLSIIILLAFSSLATDLSKLQDFFMFWSSTIVFYFLSLLILSICSYCSVVLNKNLKTVFIIVFLSSISTPTLGIIYGSILYLPVAILGVCVCCGISIGSIVFARKVLRR
jgi:hypothetical protein